MSRFSHILDPVTAGNIKLKNRLFMDAMAVGYLDAEGKPTERLWIFDEWVYVSQYLI